MQLLMAEGKGYVQANITLITRLLTYGVKIVLACMKVNIVAIQFGFFCVSLIQLAIYKWYIEKNYGWIKYDLKSCENIELPDKNAYVLTEIAWTVFSSTDMILLSILFSTALSSVYSVYNLVYSNISGLMNSVYTSLIYLLGQAYSESLRKYEQVHDEFELMFMTGAAIFNELLLSTWSCICASVHKGSNRYKLHICLFTYPFWIDTNSLMESLCIWKSIGYCRICKNSF